MAAEDSPGVRCAYGRIGHSRQHYSDHEELGVLGRWLGEVVPAPEVTPVRVRESAWAR
jgi:hypothetical protein